MPMAEDNISQHWATDSTKYLLSVSDIAIVHKLSNKTVWRVPYDKSSSTLSKLWFEAKIYCHLGRHRRNAGCIRCGDDYVDLRYEPTGHLETYLKDGLLTDRLRYRLAWQATWHWFSSMKGASFSPTFPLDSPRLTEIGMSGCLSLRVITHHWVDWELPLQRTRLTSFLRKKSHQTLYKVIWLHCGLLSLARDPTMARKRRKHDDYINTEHIRDSNGSTISDRDDNLWSLEESLFEAAFLHALNEIRPGLALSLSERGLAQPLQPSKAYGVVSPQSILE